MPESADVLDAVGRLNARFDSEARDTVTRGLDGDKKRAATSFGAGKDAGEDPQVIYSDFDRYMKRRKSEVAGNLIEGDSSLKKWIQDNPLSSTVGQDDWGALSAYSERVKEFSDIALQSIGPAGYGIKGGISISRGLYGAVMQQNPEMFAGFLEAQSYNMPAVMQGTMRGAAGSIREFAKTGIPPWAERHTKSWEEIDSAGRALEWAFESIGSGIGSSLPSIVVGGAGLVGGTAVGGPIGGFIGGVGGAGAVSYVMSQGELYDELLKAGLTPEVASGWSSVGAIPLAALDAASLGRLGAIAGLTGAKKQISQTFAKTIIKAIAEGSLTEGATESAQEIMQNIIVNAASGKPLDENMFKGALEAGVAGALAGGAMAGGVKVYTQSKELQQLRTLLNDVNKTIEDIEPWTKAGQPIPQGLNANIDQLIALHSTLTLEKVDAFIEYANKTETKELSIEAFRDLAGIQFGDRTAYIRWDAVKAIYGEERPAPDDKKLGWIPDIGSKFERSSQFGEPIEVKLADLVAADPEAYKLIQDEFFLEDGMNRKVAEELLKEKPEFSSIHETEMPGLSEDLRRAYTLKDVGEGVHDVLDEKGEKTGQVSVTEQNAGKNLFIGWEKGQYDTAGLITLMNQLKAKYPNAETISTVRIPGVRSLEQDLQGSTIGVDMPFRIKERPVDLVRRAAGLNPLFDLSDEGPRAARIVPGYPAGLKREEYATDKYTITDESGRPLAALEMEWDKKQEKAVYIGWLGKVGFREGVAEKAEETLSLLQVVGPTNIKSFVAQLQELYPGAEKITFIKQGGAGLKAAVKREKELSLRPGGLREGDMWEGKRKEIILKDLMDEAENMPAGWHPLQPLGPQHERLLELISQGWEDIGGGRMVEPPGKMSLKEFQLEETIDRFLNRITGGNADILTARNIKGLDERGEKDIAGFFRFYENRRPFIMWALEGPDPYATAGHEAIHFLRHFQYIMPEEWEALKKAAEERGWLDTPAMKRYEHFKTPELMELYYEEAIADEFKKWARMDRENQKLHGMAKVFQKILDAVDAVKAAWSDFRGKTPDADQIMRAIQIGHVGRRKPLGPSAKRMEMFGLDLADEKPTPIEEKVPTFAPGAIMDKKKYAQYQRNMNAQAEDDIRIEREKALAEIKRRNAPEWKANREEMRKDVEMEIGRRPDARARAFFQNGSFYGGSTHYMPKVNPRALTKEQREQFPARWQEVGGMNPDDLAQPFGFQTGSGMIDALIRFEKEKGKLTPKEFLDKMIDKETDRRMEQKYGDQAAQNLEEAIEQAVGPIQLDLLKEEAVALGSRAGMQISLTKENIQAMAHSAFIDMPQKEGTYKYFMREMYRTGKAAESRFLVGDYIGAFQEKWMQVHLLEMARQVKSLEKNRRQLERVTKRFYDRYPKNFPAEFTEFIQLLMTKAGYEVDRLPGDLESMFALRDHKGDLNKFVDTMNELPPGFEDFETAVEPYLIIPDFILDNPDWSLGGKAVVKLVKDMTVGEFKAFNDALQSLQKIGADQGKLHRMGEEADLQKELTRAKEQLKAIGPEKPLKRHGKRKTLHQWYHKGTLAPEDLFLRLDKGDEEGFFTQFITDPMNDRAYAFDQLHKEFRKKRIEIDKKYGGTTNNPIENNVFVDPMRLKTDPQGKIIPPRQRDYIQATHQMVRTVLLNWGNKSNRERLVEGHFIKDEASVEAWLQKVATKNDFLWAEAIGRLYDELYGHSSEVTMRESNTMVERIPLPQISTPFGMMDGWYYPVHYDRSKDGGPKRTEVVSPPRLKRTARGWERKRTGPAGPLDLTLDPLDLDMNKRIHDIAYREVLRDLRKIKNDRGLRQMIELHMGRHYVEMLDNLHDDVAQPYRPNSGALQSANKFSEIMRQNTIMALVGFSTGTFMKHVPSTFGQSMARVGIFRRDFYSSAMEFMPVHPRFIENWSFVYSGGEDKMVGTTEFNGSREIQKRWRHYAQAHGIEGYGMTDLKSWLNSANKIREKIMDWSSRPVAAGDILSSVITWNAVYKSARKQYMEEGMTLEQAHVKADTRADFAVRQTHGSTSIMRRPELMRRADSFSRWFTSLFAYYNHVYGNLYRMAWRSKDFRTERRLKEPTTQTATEYASEMTSLSMAYIILPAAFYWFAQDFLLGKDDDEDESLAWKIAKPVIHNVGGAFLGIRDVIGFMSGGGQQPVPGIIGVPLQAFWNLARNFDPEKEWKETDPGKVIKYLHGFAGVAAGLSSNQVGMWNQFIYNYTQGVEEPEDAADWYRAARRGTIERRKH